MQADARLCHTKLMELSGGSRQHCTGTMPNCTAIIFHLLQVNEAFEELEDGNEDALKEVLDRQKAQLRC